MDPLPHAPRDFRELVEADLRRAARLVIKVQDEIDPQLRIATPTGDWAIAVTLPSDDRGRHDVLRAVATFMGWKQATAFTFASELVTPDCVYCVGIATSERHACASMITRLPKPWSKANFGPVEWLLASSIDPAISELLPTSPRPLTPKDVSAMVKWFGREGRFPAINMTTGDVGA